MKPLHPKYDREPELHEIYERLLERVSEDSDGNLTPRIDNLDAFMKLFWLQGRLWLKLYEAEPWGLIRFMLSGSEKAFNLSELPQQGSTSALKDLIDKLSQAISDPDVVDTDAIDDSIKLKAVPIVLVSRCFQVSFVCMLRFKVSIQQLIHAARTGDLEAFVDLVKLDSAFMLSDFGQKYLIEAELRQIDDFKEALADALEPDPKFWSFKGKRNHYCYLMLWMLDDFAYRPDSEWAQFFADHGFDTWADQDNVRRNRERYNLPKLKR